MEIIRQAADPKCSAHLENAVRTVDAILLRGDDAFSKTLKRHLKGLFGVAELEHDENAQFEARDLDLEDLPIEDLLLEKRAKKVAAVKPKAARTLFNTPRVFARLMDSSQTKACCQETCTKARCPQARCSQEDCCP